MGEITERLDRLEGEVKKLRGSFQETVNQLSQTVEELKRAVIDIRSAITEIENPFNLLRVISSEEELHHTRRLAKQVPAKLAGTPKEGRPEKLVDAVKPKPVEGSQEEVVRRVVEAKPVSKPTGFSIIKWVWALLDAGLDKEDVLNISKYCECVGYLPPRSSEYVGYVVDAMSKARLGGLNLEEFMLIIYGAIKTSGLRLEMKELEEISYNLLRRILKKVSAYEGVK